MPSKKLLSTEKEVMEYLDKNLKLDDNILFIGFAVNKEDLNTGAVIIMPNPQTTMENLRTLVLRVADFATRGENIEEICNADRETFH